MGQWCGNKLHTQARGLSSDHLEKLINSILHIELQPCVVPSMGNASCGNEEVRSHALQLDFGCSSCHVCVCGVVVPFTDAVTFTSVVLECRVDD
eukprot:910063-Amphidinium_carterae.1